MDKSKLLASGRISEGTVDLPGLGKVRVRGLSRGEILELREDTGTNAEQERKWLAKAMLDPVLTEDEVKQWQSVAVSDEVTMVTEEIYRLSGFGEGAQKSDAQGVSG
jgi:hypothetical protein